MVEAMFKVMDYVFMAWISAEEIYRKRRKKRNG